MKHRWQSPAEWLAWRLREDRAAQERLYRMLTEVLKSGKLDNEDIQELWEEQMDQDGYFDKEIKSE
jgi:hypothetical protein